MSEKFDEALKKFDEEYTEAVRLYDDDDDLMMACDQARSQFLRKAFELATTKDEYQRVLIRLLDRHESFRSDVLAKLSAL